MKYENSHRTFLQIVMHYGIMSDCDVERTVAKIFNHEKSASFHIAFMNLKLEQIGMMIKSGLCESTGQKFWALTTTTADPVAQFQTIFTPYQLDLLRKVFIAIINSPVGNVASTTCLNFCMDQQNQITKADAEQFLNGAVGRKWLDIKDGFYYMGVRSIIELMPYFRATFEEGFNICPLCQHTVFHGRKCEVCEVVAHLYCLANLARFQNPLKCKNCNNSIDMNNLPDVPERELEVGGTDAAPTMDHPSKRSKTSHSKKKERR